MGMTREGMAEGLKTVRLTATPGWAKAAFDRELELIAPEVFAPELPARPLQREFRRLLPGAIDAGEATN
jgi:hypothetical protein